VSSWANCSCAKVERLSAATTPSVKFSECVLNALFQTEHRPEGK
jgi:hypothetical protein